MKDQIVSRYIRPRYKIKVVKPHKEKPTHLPKVMIGLTATVLILAAFKERKVPSKEDVKSATNAAIRGLLLL